MNDLWSIGLKENMLANKDDSIEIFLSLLTAERLEVVLCQNVVA